MVRKAREFAEKEGVADRITILEMNAEALEFPDETFDIVFGHSILHHLDLEAARVGIYRVLKRGGKGIFLEPLGHNVFINIFRKITPHRRTPTEKPLLMEDILFLLNLFPVCAILNFSFWLCAPCRSSLYQRRNSLKEPFLAFRSLTSFFLRGARSLVDRRGSLW
jgi:SAM-dependent methyltransferase